METNIIFNIGAGQLIIGMCIFFFALFAVIWKGKDEITKAIKEAIGDFKDRFIIIEDRMKILWKDEFAPTGSPRQLNERGNNILNGSGIKEIIDSKRNDFLSTAKSQNIANPYDAEKYVLKIVADLKTPELIDNLKTGMYNTGSDIDTVLFVGGIYLRDLIFPDLGFATSDLDKPKNEKGISINA